MDEALKRELQIPKSLIDKVYEVTGKGDTYKGFLMAFSDKEGNVKVITQVESGTLLLALKSGMIDYCKTPTELE